MNRTKTKTKFDGEKLRTLGLCLAVFLSVALSARAAENADAWNHVWQALQSQPAAAQTDGPPVRDGERILLRFRAPAETAQVYLAGSFNAWAKNVAGVVTAPRFAMRSSKGGVWYKWVALPPQVCRYKYVLVDKSGRFRWLADPQVKDVDADGNTVLDVSALDVSALPETYASRSLAAPKPLRTVTLPAPFKQTLEVRADNVWVRPDQTNRLVVTLTPQASTANTRLELDVRTPLGASVYKASQKSKAGENRLTIPALKREGGFLARVTLTRAGRALDQGETVLSVVKNVADDLRYGFYATYGKHGEAYDDKAASFARFHINAVEFYDYFPAHGNYAPQEAEYKFEPFGIPLSARDVQRKINAGHRRSISSVAYVAAYAASESVYRQHPDPMTDAAGIPKVFNGSIMTEAEADHQKKAKWFWLMDIASGSPWHIYILDDFSRTLDDSPDDFVSFDGFEMDTYGDSADTKFYAKGSARNGDLLSDVLHDFVGDVHALTHKIKPQGLVSFNSVNEFSVEKMADVTDFLFLEIWDFYADTLEDLVDICFANRDARMQRVILKLYPATMHPARKSWPENTLRRVLGAAMTGAGTLMVAGEPDTSTGKMHALQTLFYPDHQVLPKNDEQVLLGYYRQDALLYGYTHGKNVVNTNLYNPVAGCITRTYAASDKHALVVQLLNIGKEKKWTVDMPASAPKVNFEVALNLPGGVAPKAVYYVSPDTPELHTPIKLEMTIQNGKLRTLIPELRVHGTLLLPY